MDLARFSTTHECRFFRDNATTATLKWYRPPPGAQVFPTQHKFGHLSWYTKPWEAVGVGEVYGSPDRWSNGATAPFVHGTHFFGKIEHFQGGAVFDSSVNVDRWPWGVAKACAPACALILDENDVGAIVLQETGIPICLEHQP